MGRVKFTHGSLAPKRGLFVLYKTTEWLKIQPLESQYLALNPISVT